MLAFGLREPTFEFILFFSDIAMLNHPVMHVLVISFARRKTENEMKKSKKHRKLYGLHTNVMDTSIIIY